MKLNFNRENEFFLTTDKECDTPLFGFSGIALSLDGNEEAQLLAAPFSSSSDFLQKDRFFQSKDKKSMSYTVVKKSVEACAEFFLYDGIDVVRQVNTVTNYGDEKRVLTRNAAQVNGICYDGGKMIKDRLSDGSIRIYFCFNKTQGEGQWRTVTPEDIGLYFASSHPWEKSFFRIDSISSYSTGAYYPLILIEDKEKNECWYFEIEGGHNWFFEIYLYGGTTASFLSVKAGGADERLGFAKSLLKDEFHQSCGYLYGVTKGGIEQGVKELIKYKRLSSLSKNCAPLVFNDYMNCNWAIQSNNRLLKLIDKAAELGCEVFCIDDGWQIEQGLWYPANEKFETIGLQGIFDYIISKGMQVGVWFEFETAPLKLREKLGDDICLTRNGSIAVSRRALGNFRSEKFLNYLFERVARLYEMGVRYIKNDHNNAEDLGTDVFDESPGEGCENNSRAFLDFIGKLKEKYSDLLIENCGGGAKRSDWGTLKYFNLQSTSDQEDYACYPSIIAGSLAQMPPEKAGIWCYPNPLEFNDRKNDKIPDEKKKLYVNGEQTVFNVVNGFIGVMYLSGRIDDMDEYNFSLLKEGVRLYKNERNFIKNSFPVFPKGFVRMSNRTDIAIGLINGKGDRMLLAVWNLSDRAREIEINLEKYNLEICKSFYPKEKNNFRFDYKNGHLNCNFFQERSAILFCLKKNK